MLKKFLLIFFTLFVTNALSLAYEPYLPEGSLVKVYTKIPITTEHLEEGSMVYFIVPSDVWVLEKKAIEKGDIFRGYVSMLKMPVQGVNAAMRITIVELVKPDGSKYPFSGRIIFSNSDILGGTLTNPASYNTTIHPKKLYKNIWGGTLQFVPSGEYEFGKHVEVTSRDNIFVQADEDYYF